MAEKANHFSPVLPAVSSLRRHERALDQKDSLLDKTLFSFFNVKIAHYVGDLAVASDKIGIIYQHGMVAFVVFEVHNSQGGRAVRCRAFSSQMIGNYLHAEWSAMPTISVGKHDVGLSRSKQSNWVCHPFLRDVRLCCTRFAQDSEILRSGYKLTAEEHIKAVQIGLQQKVEEAYRILARQEKQQASQARKAFSMFCKMPVDPLETPDSNDQT